MTVIVNMGLEVCPVEQEERPLQVVLREMD